MMVLRRPVSEALAPVGSFQRAGMQVWLLFVCLFVCDMLIVATTSCVSGVPRPAQNDVLFERRTENARRIDNSSCHGSKGTG
jgi:hypothetical protein